MEKAKKKKLLIIGGSIFAVSAAAIFFGTRKKDISDKAHVIRTVNDALGPEAAARAADMSDEEAEIVSTALNPDAPEQAEDYSSYQEEYIPASSGGGGGGGSSSSSSAPAAPAASSSSASAPVISITPKAPAAFTPIIPGQPARPKVIVLPQPVQPVKKATAAITFKPVATAVKGKLGSLSGLGSMQEEALGILKKYGVFDARSLNNKTYSAAKAGRFYSKGGGDYIQLKDDFTTLFKLTGKTQPSTKVGYLVETDQQYIGNNVWVLKDYLIERRATPSGLGKKQRPSEHIHGNFSDELSIL